MMFRSISTAVAIVVATMICLAGCGGSSESTQEEPGASQTQAKPAPSGVDKGIGPITHVDVSALTSEDATVGAEVFQTKCTACHKIEERYIGPALTGVTKRRAPEWIMNMILNPDVMVRENETAKALLAEYLAPMTNQNLTEDEARSVLAFFIENDSEMDDDSHDEADEVE